MRPPMNMGGPPPGEGGPRPGRGNISGPPPEGSMGGPPPELFIEEFDMKQMERESEEMLRMNYLNSTNAFFEKTKGGFLNLITEGVTYERVQLVRTFPFSDPDIFLSVRDSSEKAKEIGIIKDFHKDFSPETVKLFEEQLTISYFAPVIKHILQVKEEGGYAYFDVQTNYGECQFAFRSNSSSVVHLSDTRLLIYDLDNNRFEIPDIRKLSANELKKLDLFI